jgi:hypothetical protein
MPPPPVDVPPPPPAIAPPPPPVASAPAGLELSDATIDPGGPVTATGLGCAPSQPVQLSVGQVPVGQTVAGPTGDFAAPLTTGAVDVGRHEVTAQCGRILSAPLDVVLVSHVGTGTSTLTLIVIFLVLGAWFYGHRLASHLPERRNDD